MNHNDLEQELVKSRILSQNTTFKAAFSATLGFYAAQFLISVVFLFLLFGGIATCVVITK